MNVSPTADVRIPDDKPPEWANSWMKWARQGLRVDEGRHNQEEDRKDHSHIVVIRIVISPGQPVS